MKHDAPVCHFGLSDEAHRASQNADSTWSTIAGECTKASRQIPRWKRQGNTRDPMIRARDTDVLGPGIAVAIPSPGALLSSYLAHVLEFTG